MPVLQPFKSRLNPKLQVPTGLLQIQKAHPLAQGLIGCFVPGVMGPIDLTKFAPQLTMESAIVFRIGREGPGLRSTAASAGMNGLAPATWKGGSQYTLYYRGFCHGASDASVNIFGMQYDTIGTAPYVVVQITTGASGWTTGNFGCAWNGGGSFNEDDQITAVAANQLVSVGGTFNGSGNVVSYKNGAAIGTPTAMLGSPTSTATSAIGLHSNGSGGGITINGTCFIACIWNRILSASEMAWIHRDPYNFLAPAEREMAGLFVSSAPLPWVEQSGGWSLPQRRPHEMIPY